MTNNKNYQVILSPQAQKYLKKIPPKIRQSINGIIAELSINPRPSGVIALKGYKGLFRLRLGDYRVIYIIEDNHVIVTIVQVGHRREIYRDW